MMIRSALVAGILLLPGYQEGAIQDSIQKGVAALKRLQAEDGCWGRDVPPGGLFHKAGVTGLVVYTLLSCDTPVTSAEVMKGLEYIIANDGFKSMSPTYEVSLRILGLAESLEKLTSAKGTVDGKLIERTRTALQKAVEWLASKQEPTGWNYGHKKDERPDNSNTQLAIMAMRAAYNVKVKPPATVWEKTLTHFKTAQNVEGGWGYLSAYDNRAADQTDSMTAACLMGTLMCMASMTDKPDMKAILDNTLIKKGFDALEKAFQKRDDLEFYWYWSLERACMLAGRKKLAGRDWYAEGSRAVMKAQDENGAWDKTYGIADHCFALLFLKKTYVPVTDVPDGKPREQSE